MGMPNERIYFQPKNMYIVGEMLYIKQSLNEALNTDIILFLIT